MAAHANIIPVPAIATALSLQADAVAKTQKKNIQNVAKLLATMMEDVHGGSWRAVVDHGVDTSFVLIRPNKEVPISKPKRGEMA